MSEHKWELQGDEYEHAYVCRVCGEVMGSNDPAIAMALNATERLSTGDAREIAMCVSKACVPQCECSHNLQAYADILEGK